MSLAEASPTEATGIELTPAIPPRINTHTKWLIVAAVLGLVGAGALGLAGMRAFKRGSAASSARLARSTAPIARVAATAAEPLVVPGAALPQSAEEPPASSAVIPWDDSPQTTTQNCEALATLGGAGPKGFLAGRAVTSAQRALVRGDTAAAHAAFCTAAQLGVPNDSVLLGLARVLFMQSDLSGALEAVDQLLARAPSNKQAHELRGDILIRMGKADEARQAWLKSAGATRASKQLIDNWIRQNSADANAALRSGDLSRADRLLRRNIALTSGDPEQCRKLIAILDKKGNAVAAERWRAYLSARG